MFSNSLWRVVVPSPKIVINLPRTYEKLHCKGEPYRFGGQRDLLALTDRHPLLYYKIYIMKINGIGIVKHKILFFLSSRMMSVFLIVCVSAKILTNRFRACYRLFVSSMHGITFSFFRCNLKFLMIGLIYILQNSLKPTITRTNFNCNTNSGFFTL